MITELEFPHEATEPMGLAPARLRDLKRMVVLAGPNGAGKSRYLRLMGDIASRAVKAQERLPEIRNELNEIKSIQLSMSPDVASLWKGSGYIEGLEKNLAEAEHYASQTTRHASSPHAFRVIPLTYEAEGPMHDPTQTSPRHLKTIVASNKTGGFSSAWASIHAYFHDVASAMHDAEHPRTKDSAPVRMGLEDARQFNHVLKALLSAEIEPDIGPDRLTFPRFRGRPFNPAELSAGETILAVWAILLHRQREWLQGACVLLDEPENHLHPDVCIRALTALQNEILGPHGQIWLATHSIPLIAHAGMESVYFVDNNSIEYAGNKIEKVITRLLGGEEGRAKLRAFISDADEIAFDTFAAQCLLPPGVASPREGDPQQKQMVDIASAVGADKENIRILDFAAGRGRLASALKQAGLAANRPFTYYAFNDKRFSTSEELGDCLQNIRRLEQPEPSESYLVDGLYKLTGPGSKPMDLVVMCNVLHEIPVDDWQRCFTDILEVLAEDGRLVILEDQLPPVGELPHENGYVILDELALKELFDSGDAVTALHQEREARLTAFAISKPALRQVTPRTIGKALGKVMRRAREEIRRIREAGRDPRTYQLGRRHAHFTLLYANAQLALERYPEQR